MHAWLNAEPDKAPLQVELTGSSTVISGGSIGNGPWRMWLAFRGLVPPRFPTNSEGCKGAWEDFIHIID